MVWLMSCAFLTFPPQTIPVDVVHRGFSESGERCVCVSKIPIPTGMVPEMDRTTTMKLPRLDFTGECLEQDSLVFLGFPNSQLRTKTVSRQGESRRKYGMVSSVVCGCGIEPRALL